MMNVAAKKKLDTQITGILDKMHLTKHPLNDWEYEIYADYRDKMSKETAINILQAEHPRDSFATELDNLYNEYAYSCKSDLARDVKKELASEDEKHSGGFTDEENDYINEFIFEHVFCVYPEKHYLNQEFCVNIMVDTGDGNYDYTLNTVYPNWRGEIGRKIDDKASVVWLSKQQGYKKPELNKALRKGEVSNPTGFFDSLSAEIANCASHMNALTFLVIMTLEELIQLNSLIRLQEQDGVYYDATKRPDCGHIVLGKEAETGLFDPWSGGGSLFEIRLENDVKLPIKLIRSALPDGGDGHSIESVYGMCESAWRSSLKEIHAPKRKRKVAS